MIKTGSRGPWKISVVLAAFGLALVFAGCPSPATHDVDIPVASVRVVPHPENHGTVIEGRGGTLGYLITIVGDGIFPVNLVGPDVSITLECGASLPNGITVNPGFVGASGEGNLLLTVTEAQNRAISYSLIATVHGVASNPFNLIVGTVASVSVVPAENPGVAIAGLAGGILNYLVTVNGLGVFPVDFPGPDVAFFMMNDDESLSPLPPGIVVNPGRIERQGMAFPLSFSVAMPTAATHRLVVRVHGEEESAPFYLNIVSGDGVAGQIARLHTGTLPPTATITVAADEEILPQSLYFYGSEIDITLTGGGNTLSLGAPGSMFTVGRGVTLRLGDLTLQGRPNNTGGALVTVSGGGNLIMGAGSFITGNSNWASPPIGGGVAVNTGGTFTMFGGEIRNNNALHGGGVFNAGTFVIEDGQIHANEADSNGGGVLNDGGSTFTMRGGEIFGNEANQGGGVRNFGTVNMYHGAAISSNTALGTTNVLGGGVFNTGTFNMLGGEIFDNAANQGGGVDNRGTFNMHDGAVISGNTAQAGGGQPLGGGVINSGTFNMHGGEFSGNSAGQAGGGMINFGTFRVENGLMHGSDTVSGLVNMAPSGAVLNSQPAATSLHGTFTGGVFASQGILFTTNLTIGVENGELIIGETVNVTVTGIPATMDGYIASFWFYRDDTGWDNVVPWAQVSGNSLSFVFSAGTWAFEVDFFELVGADDVPVLRATYTVSATFATANNAIPFDDFVPTRGHGLRSPPVAGGAGLILPSSEMFRLLPAEGVTLPGAGR